MHFFQQIVRPTATAAAAYFQSWRDRSHAAAGLACRWPGGNRYHPVPHGARGHDRRVAGRASGHSVLRPRQSGRWVCATSLLPGRRCVFLQVTTVGGDLEAMKAFVYCETVNPPSKQAFQEFVMQHPHLGAAQIEYAGKQWQRATQSTDDAARISTHRIRRSVVPLSAAASRWRSDPLRHALQPRRARAAARRIFLLVTGEDSGPNEFCVTYAVGIDVTVADLDIT